jgi:hypothetical protein
VMRSSSSSPARRRFSWSPSIPLRCRLVRAPHRGRIPRGLSSRGMGRGGRGGGGRDVWRCLARRGGLLCSPFSSPSWCWSVAVLCWLLGALVIRFTPRLLVLARIGPNLFAFRSRRCFTRVAGFGCALFTRRAASFLLDSFHFSWCPFYVACVID